LAVLPTADRFRRVSPPLRRLALLLTVGALVTAVSVPVLAREAEPDDVPAEQPGDGGQAGTPVDPDQVVRELLEQGVIQPDAMLPKVPSGAPLVGPIVAAELAGAEAPAGGVRAEGALSAATGVTSGAGSAATAVAVGAVASAATEDPLAQTASTSPNLDPTHVDDPAHVEAPALADPAEGTTEVIGQDSGEVSHDREDEGKKAQDITTPGPVAITQDQGAPVEAAGTTDTGAVAQEGTGDKAATQGGPKVNAQVKPPADQGPVPCEERDCWWADPQPFTCFDGLDEFGDCAVAVGEAARGYTLGVNVPEVARDWLMQNLPAQVPETGPGAPAPGPGGGGTPPGGSGVPGPDGQNNTPAGGDGSTEPGGTTPPGGSGGATNPGSAPTPTCPPTQSCAGPPSSLPGGSRGLTQSLEASFSALTSAEPLGQPSAGLVEDGSAAGGGSKGCEDEQYMVVVRNWTSPYACEDLRAAGRILREGADAAKAAFPTPLRPEFARETGEFLWTVYAELQAYAQRTALGPMAP
jgi:hypothetical protein